MTPAFTTVEGAIRPMWQIEREATNMRSIIGDGNVLNAAVLLELSPSTVYRKKQAWESEDEYKSSRDSPNNVNEPSLSKRLIPVLGEIWLFIDSQTFGGIETHVLELAKGLLNHGNKVRVVLLTQYMPGTSFDYRAIK